MHSTPHMYITFFLFLFFQQADEAERTLQLASLRKLELEEKVGKANSKLDAALKHLDDLIELMGDDIKKTKIAEKLAAVFIIYFNTHIFHKILNSRCSLSLSRFSPPLFSITSLWFGYMLMHVHILCFLRLNIK
jgi:hypothetical protein